MFANVAVGCLVFAPGLLRVGRRIGGSDLALDTYGAEVVFQNLLLFRVDLRQNLLLIGNCLFGLFVAQLDRRVHPVLVITGGLDVEIVKLLLYVFPDLSILQVWIQLHQFHVLFLERI